VPSPFFFLGCSLFFRSLLDSCRPGMDTRFCSQCVKRLSPPFFLQDASSLPSSKVFATCYICRERRAGQKKRKRPALQEIDPNIGPPPTQRRATSISQVPFRPSTINQCPIPPVRPPVSPVQPSRPPPIQPPLPVRPPPPETFLPADQ
jgi:hypothetical protein